MVVSALFVHALLAACTSAHRTHAAQEELVVPVEVLYVRHGHGCHNAFVDQGKLKGSGYVDESGNRTSRRTLDVMKGMNYVDPPLTDCGMSSSARAGAEVRAILEAKQWTPHFLASSTMLRTMETSLAMFPNMTVFPLPFMKEKDLRDMHGVHHFVHYGNVPTLRSVSEQKEILKGKPVNFSYVPTEELELRDNRLGIMTGHSWEADDARHASAHTAWRAWVGEQLLPDILDRRAGPEEPLRLIMVSHNFFLGNTLKKHFKCKKWGGKNNAAMFVKFNYFAERRRLVEVPEYCEPAIDGKASHWDKPYLCKKDYARCWEHGGDEWLKEDPGRPGYSMYIETLPDATPMGCCVDA